MAFLWFYAFPSHSFPSSKLLSQICHIQRCEEIVLFLRRQADSREQLLLDEGECQRGEGLSLPHVEGQEKIIVGTRFFRCHGTLFQSKLS